MNTTDERHDGLVLNNTTII